MFFLISQKTIWEGEGQPGAHLPHELDMCLRTRGAEHWAETTARCPISRHWMTVQEDGTLSEGQWKAKVFVIRLADPDVVKR